MKKLFSSKKDKEPVPAPAKPRTSVPAAAQPAASAVHRPPAKHPENGSEKATPSNRPLDHQPVSIEMVLERLPQFKDVPVSEKPVLFLKKLKIASWIADWSDSLAQVKEKETKRTVLLELVEHSSSSKQVFREDNLKEVVDMIAANIFRALPPEPGSGSSNPSPADNYDPEEDEPCLEPSWPHLQYVYEFFLRFIVSSEVDHKQAKKYIDQTFILKMLDLFDSSDPRERDYLKTILHRIYGKFMTLRPFIRKSINNIFYTFIYVTEKHNGIAELLEILGSIINGFALPLKEEHKTFLKRALIPLHKPKCMMAYHQQLSYCLTQFVEKDPTLADIVIEGLLKYWPMTNSQKEVLFITELEEILDLTQKEQFKMVQSKLFQRLAQCFNSQHFQVAERALFLWNNEYVVSLIAQSRRELLPIVYPALQSNSQKHWNTTVNGIVFNVQKLLMEMDPDLYEAVSQEYRQKQAKEEQDRKSKTEKWKELERIARGK